MKNSMKFILSAATGLAGMSLFAGPAWAQEAAKLDSGDTAWMLTATAIVLMMTIPGLALFYGGMVRKKNVLTTMMQSFAITCLISIIWMVVGYSIAFTDGGNDFIGGFSRILLDGLESGSLTGTIPESVFIVFQMTFAIITVALFTGAFAERMKFSALLWFAGTWSILIYSPSTAIPRGWGWG